MKKTLLILPLTLLTLSLTACSKNQEPSTLENSDQQTATQNDAATVPKTMPVGDTAENSLDWAGEYKGTFPCADCEGIEIELKLNPDKTYELQEEYISDQKSTEIHTKGSFSFDANQPSIITLDQKGEKRKFFVGENFVEARDIQTGEKINSSLNYKLIKDIN